MSEIIVYTYKNRELYAKRMKDLVANRHKLGSRLIASFHNKFVSYALEKSLNDWGFSSKMEIESFMLQLSDHRSFFPSDEKFNAYVRDMLEKRKQQANRKDIIEKSSITKVEDSIKELDLASVLNDEVRIICRILGTNTRLIDRYVIYYCRQHNISEPVFAVENEPEELDRQFDFNLSPEGVF